jgi:hypothetical protein
MFVLKHPHRVDTIDRKASHDVVKTLLYPLQAEPKPLFLGS